MASHLCRDDEEAAIQRQRLHGSSIEGVQGVASDVALLLIQPVHISAEPDDIPLSLLIPLRPHEQQAAQHRR